jgi:hypothetical protein
MWCVYIYIPVGGMLKHVVQLRTWDLRGIRVGRNRAPRAKVDDPKGQVAQESGYSENAASKLCWTGTSIASKGMVGRGPKG